MNLGIFNLRDAAICNCVKRIHYFWNSNSCGSQLHKKALIFTPGLNLHGDLINGSLVITRLRSQGQAAEAAEPASQTNRKRGRGDEVQVQKEPCFLPATIYTLQLSLQAILEMSEERPKLGIHLNYLAGCPLGWVCGPCAALNSLAGWSRLVPPPLPVG